MIKGTRIGVNIILEKTGADETIDELLNAYPSLNKDAMLACIRYGAASVRNGIVLDIE